MPCIHLVTAETFPMTRCGVNTNEKTGAYWTDGEDAEVEVSCKNCCKLRDGLPMGAPPPANGGKKEKREKAISTIDGNPDTLTPTGYALLGPYLKRVDQLDRLQARIKSLLMDVRTGLGDVLVEEELSDMVAAVEYMEAADARLTMVLDQIRYRLKEEREGLHES